MTTELATHPGTFRRTARMAVILVSAIMEATTAWASKHLPDAKPPKKVRKSKGAARLEAIGQVIAKSDFGCQRSNVRELIGLIIGKTIPALPDCDGDDECRGRQISRRVHEKLVALVPTGNDNGHNYTRHSVALHGPVHASDNFYGNDRFYMQGGTEGNHMTASAAYLRPATRAEVEAFVKAMPDHFFQTAWSWLPEAARAKVK